VYIRHPRTGCDMIKSLFIQKDNHTHCKSNREVDIVIRERRCVAVCRLHKGGVVTKNESARG